MSDAPYRSSTSSQVAFTQDNPTITHLRSNPMFRLTRSHNQAIGVWVCFPAMLPSVSGVRGCSLSLLCAFCSSLVLLLCHGSSEASIYHVKGLCTYKDERYQPGESFWRGCDKCFCHDSGFYCSPPMKPTSWPRKCLRVRTECSYKVVYKENPLLRCRAYSWIR